MVVDAVEIEIFFFEYNICQIRREVQKSVRIVKSVKSNFSLFCHFSLFFIIFHYFAFVSFMNEWLAVNSMVNIGLNRRQIQMFGRTRR